MDRRLPGIKSDLAFRFLSETPITGIDDLFSSNYVFNAIKKTIRTKGLLEGKNRIADALIVDSSPWLGGGSVKGITIEAFSLCCKNYSPTDAQRLLELFHHHTTGVLKANLGIFLHPELVGKSASSTFRWSHCSQLDDETIKEFYEVSEFAEQIRHLEDNLKVQYKQKIRHISDLGPEYARPYPNPSSSFTHLTLDNYPSNLPGIEAHEVQAWRRIKEFHNLPTEYLDVGDLEIQKLIVEDLDYCQYAAHLGFRKLLSQHKFDFGESLLRGIPLSMSTNHEQSASEQYRGGLWVWAFGEKIDVPALENLTRDLWHFYNQKYSSLATLALTQKLKADVEYARQPTNKGSVDPGMLDQTLSAFDEWIDLQEDKEDEYVSYGTEYYSLSQLKQEVHQQTEIGKKFYKSFMLDLRRQMKLAET